MQNPLDAAVKAIVYGILEGLTEWLPVSSTGHMIILNAIPGFDLQTVYGRDFWEFFLVVIQFGAILAVIWKFFKKLNPLSDNNTKEHNRKVWLTWLKILIGCLPAGIAGVLLELLLPDGVTDSLNSVPVVASMLLLYGAAFVLIERLNKKKARDFQLSLAREGLDPNTPYPYKYQTVGSFGYLTVFYIGLIQMLSIIPGTSRSGVTILGALLLCSSRGAAAEFRFYLSIPIMLGATLVKGISFYRSGTILSNNMIVYLFFGVLTAFLVSLVVIGKLMQFVKKHSFEGFGYYRLGLGALLVILFAIGLI